MDVAKTSVEEQLEHIDHRLDAADQPGNQPQEYAEVLSGQGLQEGSLIPHDPAHAPFEAQSQGMHDSLGGAAQVQDPVSAQALPEAPSPADPAMLLGQVPLETADNVELTQDFHDQMAQVLASFSDSWVTEMNQRVGVLREQITLVHNKLDQFSPR